MNITQDSAKEQEIIDQLSGELKSQLAIESNKVIMNEKSILRKHFSLETLMQLVKITKERKYLPEECVISHQQQFNANPQLFFVERGRVEIYIPVQGTKCQKQIRVIEEGECFGEFQFFTGTMAKIDVRSIGYTTLVMIGRDEFIGLIKNNSIEYETFCMIKDKLVEGNVCVLKKPCFTCGTIYHDCMRCPLV